MSESIKNIKERSEIEGSEETFEEISLPKDVYNANWRDDIVEEAEEERKEATGYEFYENEFDYERPQTEVNAETQERIKFFSRTRLRGAGSKTLRFVGKVA